MFQVTRSGAWVPDGRLYKSLRIGLVLGPNKHDYLCPSSRPRGNSNMSQIPTACTFPLITGPITRRPLCSLFYHLLIAPS